jgi:hypothetical protein
MLKELCKEESFTEVKDTVACETAVPVVKMVTMECRSVVALCGLALQTNFTSQIKFLSSLCGTGPMPLKAWKRRSGEVHVRMQLTVLCHFSCQQCNTLARIATRCSAHSPLRRVHSTPRQLSRVLAALAIMLYPASVCRTRHAQAYVPYTVSTSESKAIPVTGLGDPCGCDMSRLPHFLHSRLADDGEGRRLLHLRASARLSSGRFLALISVWG